MKLPKVFYVMQLIGVFEYIPVIFSDEHFHLVNMCIYATLTEFKIQIPKHLQPDESPIISAFLS